MKVLTLFALLFSTQMYCQELDLDIHERSLKEYIAIEESAGNERLPNTTNYVSNQGLAQPITYLRKEDVIPDLNVHYFFTEEDSVMSYINYEWDVSNFEEQDNNQKSKEFQEALINKYLGIKKEITEKYGSPEVKRNYSDISQLDSVNTYTESSNWAPNDSTEIEMYITASNYYEKKGAITINPTHRIRLYVRNQAQKKETELPKLDKAKLSDLEKIKDNFFKALSRGNLSKAKTYLSEKILETVTDQQLKVLSDNIDFERQTALLYSGIQMDVSGGMYTLLQFKYADDESDPPQNMIKIIFDDKDKILGIQPLNRQ